MIAVELSAMYATVSGFEIPTRDPERSTRFYREVFDWSVEPVAWAGPPYYRVGTAIPKLGTARDRRRVDRGRAGRRPASPPDPPIGASRVARRRRGGGLSPIGAR
jgi:catechol 2,3-dioxygenase-like lactoylglutathione lyase family enzyme